MVTVPGIVLRIMGTAQKTQNAAEERGGLVPGLVIVVVGVVLALVPIAAAAHVPGLAPQSVGVLHVPHPGTHLVPSPDPSLLGTSLCHQQRIKKGGRVSPNLGPGPETNLDQHPKAGVIAQRVALKPQLDLGLKPQLEAGQKAGRKVGPGRKVIRLKRLGSY